MQIIKHFRITHVFLLFIFCGLTSNAQFKNVAFKNDEKPDLQNLINPDFKKADRTSELNNYESSVYNTVDFNLSTSEFRTGLRPGVLNELAVPAYIEGKLLPTLQRRTTLEGRAMDYLSAAAPLMKIQSPDDEFLISNIVNDDLGITHIKMQQVYKNIPVFGAETILHGEGGEIDFLNGRYYPTPYLDNVTPTLDEVATREIVISDLGSLMEYEEDIFGMLEIERIKSELVIFIKEGHPYLCRHYTVFKNIIDKWAYFTDTHTGDIIEKYINICKLHPHNNGKSTCNGHHFKPDFKSFQKTDFESITLLDGNSTATAQDLFNINRTFNTYQAGTRFYMIDGARDIFSTASVMPNDPKGVLWTIDAFNTSPQKSNFKYDHITSNNNTWTSKNSVSAHYNGGKAFEYFRNVHNRRSINGSSGNIISFINVAEDDGSSMGNAFWNGAAMFYGNGDSAFRELARGLDVAGHEMTHGVVQSTANLEYQGESGALNESFADVFGAMIDRDDWLIGEDVVRTNAFPSGALRSMENPHNGASTNDFNRGWQPKHYNERYTGNEDNGGVHINSGIPNHAFFRFATAIGKDKAEKVYYRTLTTYLTKSSKFIDCRIAVIKAATDLHGANSAEVNAAKAAFDAVGILGEQGGNYEVDVDPNPGQEFILATSGNGTGLFLLTTAGTAAGTLSNRTVISKPSISDDGTEIVFVGSDNHIYNLVINWTTNQVQEFRLSNQPSWRNVVISRDGLKVAALTTNETNEINVFHFGSTVTSSVFELYNPTFSAGVNTGDVLFADALEFDFSGEYVMYDAKNRINSNSSGTIEYFDIGFLKVWNNQSNTFSLGSIEKLFSALPDDVSIGNATFSKNSPYIIAFDYLEGDDSYILGSNIETGEVSVLFENNTLGYPNYSSKDNRLIFDNDGTSSTNLGIMNLKTNKIEAAANPTLLVQNRSWATWFSNGKRDLTSLPDINRQQIGLSIFPNPAAESFTLKFENIDGRNATIEVISVEGRVMLKQNHDLSEGVNEIGVSLLNVPEGVYFVKLKIEDQQFYHRIIKTGQK
ncbi:MAG: M4 family metallopeptidase [Saprospiraceae bacterium]|nr:M4 family metallopeptidase [Saprospiraceae bacterium]